MDLGGAHKTHKWHYLATLAGGCSGTIAHLHVKTALVPTKHFFLQQCGVFLKSKPSESSCNSYFCNRYLLISTKKAFSNVPANGDMCVGLYLTYNIKCKGHSFRKAMKLQSIIHTIIFVGLFCSSKAHGHGFSCVYDKSLLCKWTIGMLKFIISISKFEVDTENFRCLFNLRNWSMCTKSDWKSSVQLQIYCHKIYYGNVMWMTGRKLCLRSIDHAKHLMFWECCIFRALEH